MKTKEENRELVREETLAIPVSANEKAAIKEAANEMGITMSAFARYVLKDFMKKDEAK